MNIFIFEDRLVNGTVPEVVGSHMAKTILEVVSLEAFLPIKFSIAQL